MMRAKLPEVLDYIQQTSNLAALEDSTSDANDTDEDAYGGKISRRSEPMTSPTRNRPVASSATAQTSAALHNIVSPTRTSVTPTGGARSTMNQRAPVSIGQAVDEEMLNSNIPAQRLSPGTTGSANISPQQ